MQDFGYYCSNPDLEPLFNALNTRQEVGFAVVAIAARISWRLNSQATEAGEKLVNSCPHGDCIDLLKALTYKLDSLPK
jgi:hypothetical protein